MISVEVGGPNMSTITVRCEVCKQDLTQAVRLGGERAIRRHICREHMKIVRVSEGDAQKVLVA